MKVQVCSKCGRARKGHPLPMGAKCKQTPLSVEERKKVVEGVDQQDIEEIVDDDLVPETPEALRAELDRMRREKEALKKQQEDVQKGLKAAEEQELLNEWKQMKEEITQMHQLVEGQQAKLINMQTKLQEFENQDKNRDKDNKASNETENPQSTGHTPQTTTVTQTMPVIQLPGQTPAYYGLAGQPQAVPGQQYGTFGQPLVYPPGLAPVAPGQASIPRAVPGVSPVLPGQVQPVPGARAAVTAGQQPVFMVPVSPAPRTPSTPMDPSLQVYARALAGQYSQPTSTQAAPTGAAVASTEQSQVFNDFPQLAAACGIPTIQSDDQGKCLAEQYIYKPQYKTVDRPNYYEFIHGALRMMKTRLTQDHLPIDDFLTYYEYIACLATQYRWHSVYDVHASHVAEIENKRKKWSDPVETNLKEKYCNAGSHLPDKEQRPTRRDIPRGSRDHKRGGGPGDRYQESDYYQKSRSASASMGWKPTCDLFNRNPYSCTFDPCRYRHECSECEVRGVKAPHSKAFCESAYTFNKSSSQSGQNNGQAGGGGR